MKISQTEAPDRITLRTTATSPYGRKTRIAVLVHGLADAIDIVPADTLDESDSLRLQNPLGKMPCLLLPDGRVMFDSRVIVEYLDSISQRAPLIPASGAERLDILTAASLCDGLTDAALLMVYEHRFREPEQVSSRYLAHQQGKVERALAALSAAPPRADHTDVVSIGLACALAYLDWRKPVSWRKEHPVLVNWLAAFAVHEPAFEQTRAPDT
ncbi:MAG: glutathione S-transferase N-terminal domain-containing protein [Burkholderiaceae bacterium]